MERKENQINGLPEVWKETNLGQEIELNYGKSLPKRDRIEGKYPVFGSNGIVDYHNKALVKGPGIIIGRKGSCGEVHYTNEDFWPIDTTYYITLRDENDLRFISYLLSSLGLSLMNYHSTIPGLNRENVYQIKCMFPPLPEQKKISAVLYEIQKAIEVQDEIIKTTQELKKSTMQHLFTHGVYNEKTKQTEIGEIPESWEVNNIGNVAKVQGGYAFKSSDYKKEGIRIFRISNVSFGRTSWDDIAFLPISFENEFSEYLLKPGDLVIALTRPIVSGGIKITRLCKEDCPCLLNQRVARFITSLGVNIEYLLQILFNPYFVYSIGLGASGSQQPNISTSQIEKILIPVPKIEEQNKIASILQFIDQKINLHEIKKESFQELFNSMLNKLMTGEIKLRY
ncbi:MAG: hypothetical protein AUJ85_01860 [Elusimicrobia bacterium CG1_02_37_114]|nr:MAG: hypothetical protein AUJ85_01860 [Elusimicrobia bacterium CG1_02_37_114]PIV52896.1 MAG: hypothetical protein COS17_06810 [Elusimicrobia bacterium CG02_land_8_20_14_3_00_37_13]PIZ12511.1 MAG: hypothetical protein COY53_09695 [Elusimicrobia bacterium CG_4_10_14_0_8_um_filter_37_32]